MRNVSGTNTALTSEYSLPQTITAGSVVHVRGRATGTSPTYLALKIWKDGAAEPAGWQLTATDSTSALQGPGSIRLLSYLAQKATNGPVQVSFDNLEAISGP